MNDSVITVTGGTGYVGHRVAKKLAAEGHKIVAVDIVPPEERGIEFGDQIEYRQADLRIPEEAERATADADYVVHLAADIGSLTYMDDYMDDILHNNCAIDCALYPAMVKNGTKHVIYSSTSMAFQHSSCYPYTEEDLKDCPPPTNVYGFSKLAGEYHCRAYQKKKGLGYTILRYHNIYGPGEDSKGATPGDIHVIPALLEKVITKKQYPIELLGDPKATRPFTFVDDAVEATCIAVQKVLAGDEVMINNDFNVGNNRYYTIEELAQVIWDMYGDDRPFSIERVDTKANTALRREVNIQKIMDAFGWEPQTSLEDGLKPTAEWIKERDAA